MEKGDYNSFTNYSYYNHDYDSCGVQDCKAYNDYNKLNNISGFCPF